MIEPTVLDYLRAAIQLKSEQFCERFPHPVLVSIGADLGDAFQEIKTRMCRRTKTADEHSTDPAIEGLAPVIAVRSDRNPRSGLIALGRSEDNDLMLEHETVSAEHATFIRDPANGHIQLTDLGSTNPTQVNDDELPAGQPRRLADGDKLAFGDCVFVFYTPAGLHRLLSKRPAR
jgi:hypothetical protein